MSMITLSGPIQIPNDPRHKGGTDDTVSLKPGDRLAAKVLRIENDQRVLMDFGRFRALAHIDRPVWPGQTFVLEVIGRGSPLHMHIIADPSMADRPLMPQINLDQAMTNEEQRELNQLLDRILTSKALVSASPNPQQLRQALVDLRELNTPRTLDVSIKEVVSWLQRSIEDHSLFFEKKLADWLLTSSTIAQESTRGLADMDPEIMGHSEAFSRRLLDTGPWSQLLGTRDLKAQLVFLKSFFNPSDLSTSKTFALKVKETTFLQKAIGQLLGHLEQQQEHLIHRSAQSHLFQVIAHWLPIKDQVHPLKLKLYYPKKERPQSADIPQYVCLLLDMDRLGPVRADLKLSGRQLQLTFSVLTQGIQQAFESALSSVMPALEALFPEVAALVQVSAEQIDRFDEEEMMILEPGGIDIQA